MWLTRQHVCSQRLRDDTEDQGALVDDELGPPQVVLVVPHVTVLELRPFDLRQIQPPDYRGHIIRRC